MSTDRCQYALPVSHGGRFGRFIALLLWITLIVPIAGCTFGRLQIGSPIDAGAEADLYPGQSKVEVLEHLGPPDQVTTLRDESTFEYFYRENLDREMDVTVLQSNFDYLQIWRRADRLVVRFDASGYVREYGVNLQTSSTNPVSE